MLVFFVFFFFFFSFSFVQGSWYQCTKGGNKCCPPDSQPRQVRFGAGDSWSFVIVQGACFTCGTGLFGNPTNPSNTKKSCWISNDVERIPELEYCSESGKNCDFSGHRLVRFGSNETDTYIYQEAEDGITCSTDAF